MNCDPEQTTFSWEFQEFPLYYFHLSDVSERFLRNPKQGDTSTTYDLVVGERTAEGAVTVHNDGDFKDFVKITFGQMVAWLEEDEEIYFQVRDPYKVRTSAFHAVTRLT
jgi:hypothetical protein